MCGPTETVYFNVFRCMMFGDNCTWCTNGFFFINTDSTGNTTFKKRNDFMQIHQTPMYRF